MTTKEILTAARQAKGALAAMSAEEKNRALTAMADALEAEADYILAENQKDMDAAAGTMGEVKLDRLRLDAGRIRGMAEGIREVVALPDPVGRMLDEREIEEGLHLQKVSVPLGVVAIIYESRPASRRRRSSFTSLIVPAAASISF